MESKQSGNKNEVTSLPLSDTKTNSRQVRGTDVKNYKARKKKKVKTLIYIFTKPMKQRKAYRCGNTTGKPSTSCEQSQRHARKMLFTNDILRKATRLA